MTSDPFQASGYYGNVWSWRSRNVPWLQWVYETFSEICLPLPVRPMAQDSQCVPVTSSHANSSVWPTYLVLDLRYHHGHWMLRKSCWVLNLPTCVLWGVENSILYALILQWLFLSHSSVELTQSLAPLVQRLPPSPTSSLLLQPFSWWVYSLCMSQSPAKQVGHALLNYQQTSWPGDSSLCLNYQQTCWPGDSSLSQSPAKQAGHSSLCYILACWCC